MKGLVAFAVGFLFAIGLGISGMTRPDVVKGFLDVFGQWNGSLMGVMVGAIGVHCIAYRLIRQRTSPILDSKFYVPMKKDIDKQLVLGAIIFGIGWGWSGICPGPGIVALASGERSLFYFVCSMLFGMKVFQLFESKFLKKRPTP